MLNFSPLYEEQPTRKESDLTDLPVANNNFGAFFLTTFIVFSTAFLILPVLLSPLIFIKIRKYLNKSNVYQVRMSNFAVANNFTYKSGIDLATGSRLVVSMKGIFGQKSEWSLASGLIYGQYNGLDFKLFSPYGKGWYVALVMTLPHKFPHIVLDSTKNNQLLSAIGVYFSEQDKITLEGDFNNYFKAYAKAPPVDTLRVLSPDLMALVVDTSSAFDIELVEDELHILARFSVDGTKNIEQLFKIADTLNTKLLRDRVLQPVYDTASRVT